MARLTKRGHSWCDLPEELLGDIIQRFHAIGDRLSFRAVCSQWRRAERAHTQPPPPMPWLVGAGYCVGMRDAAIHRIALPEDDACAAAACRGTFDNWLAMVPMSQPPYQPFLLNPFTMARIQLPVWAGPEAISKITLSSAPDSESCTVAAIAASEFTRTLQRGSIAVCRLSLTGQPCSSSSWWYIVKAFHLQDIVFFEGKLHAVDGAEQMYAFEDQDLDKMRRRQLFRRVPEAPLSAHNRYYLVACHGRLLMVRRSFGTNRVPGGACHTVGFKVSAVSKDSYGTNKNSPLPPAVPIKAFEGHALFVGDACCRAFAIADGSSSKIKENQICYADDESNSSTPVVFLDDDSAAGWTVEGMMRCHRPPLLGSTLQSYDVLTGCFRRYQRRRRRPAAGAWQCVMAERLLHRRALPPPPTTERGASLLLWEVMKSLGANETPCYCRGAVSSNPDTHVIDLFVPVYDQNWRFTQSGRSVQEAKQEAAYEAVRFLRSRYRAILDDSPWSSIPHYHSHVDEEIYNEDEEIEDQI